VRLEIFMAVRIQVVVFCVVMPCSDVVAYQHFGGPSCLHLHPEDEGSLVFHITTWCHKPEHHHSKVKMCPKPNQTNVVI